VGLAPKALARTLRFQNALRLAGRGLSRSWSGIAAECGYADQAHLIREFRALSGATPAERADDGELARNFVTPARLEELLRPNPDVAFLQDAGRGDP
jgi:AraC-like DNA-binding protein